MFYKNSLQKLFYLLGCFIILNFVFIVPLSRAQTIDELQQKIKEHNDTIAKLQKEIDQYQDQVVTVGKQANTLSNTIKTLDLSKNQIQTSVAQTGNKIESTNLQIKKLNIDISNKQGIIEDSRASVANALKQINEHDQQSLVSTLLSYDNLSDFWNEVDTLDQFQTGVRAKIAELENLKAGLVTNKTQSEQKKADLLSLQKQLAAQKSALEDAISEKAKLLKDTKNQESSYKALIADRTAKKSAFEQELTAYESQLHIAIDPNSIPHSGSGILKYPVDNVYITQYFGNTPFATANPQGYSGQGHNGIDFRAAIGTPVKAAMDGVISGTGNTSLIRTCLSYGKWVLIKHADGLSTLYGHLSTISVKTGDAVKAGDIIALSGNTGYVTGPHLHFTVFATQGVRIGTIASSVNCRGAILPISDTHAYLNPLSYL